MRDLVRLIVWAIVDLEVGKVVEATALTAYIGFGGEGVRDFRSNTAFLSDSYEIR